MTSDMITNLQSVVANALSDSENNIEAEGFSIDVNHDFDFEAPTQMKDALSHA